MSDPTSTPERAFRAISDAVGVSRPRRPEDAADASIPVAATVVIVRDGTGGPEVLLIERPDRGSFAGAWVFPGGKLEEADRLSAGEPEEDSARRAGVRETAEETGVLLDGDSLVPVSCWDPPPGLPLRIRTWFFAARDPGGALALSVDETVAAEWVRPHDALVRHGHGELTLYPPTWVTLHDLAGRPDADALLAALRLGGLHRFETVARHGPTGPMLLWQEDAEYEADASAEVAASGSDPAAGGGSRSSASRHRLEVGALPWLYTRVV